MSNENHGLGEKREFFAWRPAAWLRVSGADSFTFLQGQFSNDLRGLGAGGAIYGLWLNHKGRVLADSFVLRGKGAEEFWVGSYFSAAAVIRERLEAFIIADDVIVEDETERWAGVTRFGMEEGNAGGSEAFMFRGRRGVEPCWEIVGPLGEAELGTPLTAVEMERRRIEAGIPAVPRDIGPGELPNEGGLETAAISYTKGCYLGQEVMARLKSMGQVRRRLLRVKGAGVVPGLPAELFQGERRVGELRSAVADATGTGFVGLALVTLLNLRAGGPLATAAGGEEVIQILDTP